MNLNSIRIHYSSKANSNVTGRAQAFRFSAPDGLRRSANIACAIVLIASVTCGAQTPIYFEDVVAPILRKNCTACHNTKLTEGGLNLESQADLLRGGDSGPAFDLAKIDVSLLLTRPVGDAETIMPPADNKVGAERLTPEQIASLKGWIGAGALTRGPTQSMTNIANLRLPESARASYAVAISPDSEFIALGRGGQLVIHDAQRLASANPIVGLLDAAPTQVIADAHPDFIQSIAISPDGQRIATGSTGQVKIWKRSEPDFDGARTALVASGIDMSKLLCATSDGNSLALVETVPAAANSANPPEATAIPTVPTSSLRIAKKDGTKSEPISVAEANVSNGDWSPSGKRLFAVGASNKLYSWDFADGAPTATTATQLPAPVQALVSMDESMLLLISERKAAVWQFKTPASAELIADHPLAVAINAAGAVDIVRASSDRQLVCSVFQDEATGNSSLKLWNVAQAKLAGVIERDRKEQMALFDSDGELRRTQAALDRTKASVTENEKALEAEQAAVKAAQAIQEKAAQAMAAKEKEMQTAAQAVTDHEKMMVETKMAIDAATEKLAKLTTDLEPKKKTLVDLAKQDMESKAMLENANKALSGIQENEKAAVGRVEERKRNVTSQNEILAGIQAKNNQFKAANEAIRFSVQTIAFSGRDRIFATKLVDKKVTNILDYFSVETLQRVDSRIVNQPITTSAELSEAVRGVRRPWQLEHVWDSPSIVVDRATAIAFSPDGTQLAIGSGLASRSGQLAIVSVADGKSIKTMPDLHSDTVLGLAFSPDGLWLASCGADKMTKLLNTQTLETAKLFEGHTHHVLALAWQEDANRLATASADMTIKLWDIAKGESVKTITGIGTEVTSIAFIGSTANTVSTAMNNLVRLHDSNSGNQVKQFGPTADSLYGVVTSPNGKYVIATGQEGIARVWNIEDGKLVGEWK